MRMFLVLSILVSSWLQPAAAADRAPVVRDHTVTLGDAPAATFDKSDWAYTNTSNPLLLTPDSLTNAMIGVSRLPRGEAFLRSAVVVPASLEPEDIRAALLARLKDKPALSVELELIAGRKVVVARYGDASRESVEYAFEFAGCLAHVLMSAKPGSYAERGNRVARKLVESFAEP